LTIFWEFRGFSLRKLIGVSSPSFLHDQKVCLTYFEFVSFEVSVSFSDFVYGLRSEALPRSQIRGYELSRRSPNFEMNQIDLLGFSLETFTNLRYQK
jgi:hypothetical protein